MPIKHEAAFKFKTNDSCKYLSTCVPTVKFELINASTYFCIFVLSLQIIIKFNNCPARPLSLDALLDHAPLHHTLVRPFLRPEGPFKGQRRFRAGV